MKNYDHNKIEKKWQGVWEKSKIYEAKTGTKGKKFYGLIEFPYPSGAGLHVGHVRSNTAMDIITRKRRMEGYNVLYPIGWDAFGLPTENYAIKTGIHPIKVTKQNTDIFRKQLKALGFGFDWSKEINTTDPAYYKWTQWIFLQMFKKGLAYKQKTEINWCPSCKIGLANEEVVGGMCDRCGGPTGKKEKEQWMLAITKYADRLDKDLDKVDYLEKIKIQQRNWIGKSEGSEIDFKIKVVDYYKNAEELSELSQKTLNLINLKKELDVFIKNNNLKAVYSGGFALASNISFFYRNHDDIDLCPLDADSFLKISEFLINKNFIKLTSEDKNPVYFLTFQNSDLKVDLIQVGIDSKKGIYDLEKGVPDYWGFHEKEILHNNNCSYFSLDVVLKLKFRNDTKDILDKKTFLNFNNKKTEENIKVFTTRIDTLFSAFAVILAPEHNLVSKLKSQITNWKEVEGYIKQVKNKTEIERTSEDKDKSGIELKGVMAINPANDEEIPVWIADFVLVQYGTGSVFADMHDERDFLFAKKYNLPLKQSIMPCHFDVKNPPIEGKKDTRRNVVHVILRNPKNKNILVEYLKDKKWGNLEPKNFIIGGIEEGESDMDAAIREVREETGYINIKFIQKIPLEVQAEFFAAHKDVNRIVHVHTLVFDLINEEKVEIEEDEYFNKETHEIKWIPESDVAKTITIPDDQMTWKYFYEGEFAFTGDGILINSGKFNGMTSAEARKEITEFVGGKIVTKYKLRDWVFSRQRYWGEPIPIIHCEKCGYVPVPEKDLPVILPNIKSYKPTDNGESPLAVISKWVNVKCPKCKGKAKRETDTMPNWAGSSWYFLRYTDPKNKKEFASKKALTYWMKNGVDWYNGGMEHTTLHLLYSRFWHKFLYDLKVVPTSEPYMKRTSHGMILAEGGDKMSKSRGNVINPDEIVKNYGADTLRIYEMFMGPFDQAVTWSSESIIGPRRFLEKIWRLGIETHTGEKFSSGPRISSSKILEDNRRDQTAQKTSSPAFVSLLHKTIKKITEDIESMSFNTAISSMMVLVNEMEKTENISIKDFKMFLYILAPFAPHIAEEIWFNLGEKKSIHKSPWPKWDKKKIVDDKVKMAVQVNGKVRSEIEIGKDLEENEVKKIALTDPNVKPWIEGKEIRKFIYVKGRIVNIVV